MNAKTVFLSTALARALGAASAAHAADAKVYPGNACQAFFGSQAGDLFRRGEFLRNESAEDRLVICPIVRDNIGNLNGVVGADVRVQSTAGALVECYLPSHSALGQLLEQDEVETTSQNVNILPLDIDISTNGGTYSLICGLPPQGRIYGYRVTEY